MFDKKKPVERDDSRKRTLNATAAAGVLPGSGGKVDVARILGLLNNSDPLIREGAIKSLVRIGGKEAQTAVITSMSDSDPRVRAAAFKGAGKLRIHQVKEQLVEALDNETELARCGAAVGLGLLGDMQGLDIIMSVAHPNHPQRWEGLRGLNLVIKKKYPINMHGLCEAIRWVEKHKKKLTKDVVQPV